jgi:hypothetical protein
MSLAAIVDKRQVEHLKNWPISHCRTLGKPEQFKLTSKKVFLPVLFTHFVEIMRMFEGFQLDSCHLFSVIIEPPLFLLITLI